MIMFTKICSIFDGKLMGKFSSPGAFGDFFSSKSNCGSPPFVFPALDQDADPPGVFGIHLEICLGAVSAVALVSPFAAGECHVVVCRPGWAWVQFCKGKDRWS